MSAYAKTELKLWALPIFGPGLLLAPPLGASGLSIRRFSCPFELVSVRTIASEHGRVNEGKPARD